MQSPVAANSLPDAAVTAAPRIGTGSVPVSVTVTVMGEASPTATGPNLSAVGSTRRAPEGGGRVPVVPPPPALPPPPPLTWPTPCGGPPPPETGCLPPLLVPPPPPPPPPAARTAAPAPTAIAAPTPRIA